MNTFLIVNILTPQLEKKAVRIDLNSKKTAIDVHGILRANKIQFSKVINWRNYKANFFINH